MNRAIWTTALTLGLAALALAAGPALAASFRFLAADPSLRPSLLNANVVMGQATHVGEVLRLEEDWEAGLGIQLSSSVVTDPTTGKLRMYYAVGTDLWHPFIALAESDDGINWTKPPLNVTGVRYVNDPRNNFIDHQNSTWINPACIFVDPNAPAAGRYKMARRVGADATRYLGLSASADGLHFQDVGVADQPGRDLDSINIAFWDPRTQQYQAHMRWNYGTELPVYTAARGVYAKRSDTWEGTWSGPREDTINPIRDSLPQLYTPGVMPYHGQYIGLPAMYYEFTNNSLYPTFMYSRNSSQWHFEDPYHSLLDLSEHGVTVDTTGMIFPATSLVERDGKLWIYYTYTDQRHVGPYTNYSYTMHLATIRQDGFVAIESAPGEVGKWTTSAITLPGDLQDLIVNAIVGGSVHVEVLDAATMQPIEGYAEADAEAIAVGDHLGASAEWQGTDGLSALAGQTVAFRFVMDDAAVYSFQFATVPEPSTLVLLVAGLIVMAAYVWRRQRFTARRRI